MKKAISPAGVSLVTAILRIGGIGVLPTDTLYGIVGSALNKKTVERIYRLRRRNKRKPMIILIASPSDLKRFGVTLGRKEQALARRVWPGKVSVILPCPSKRLAYLHRGTKSLAFRLPESEWLRALLKKTGPLVAPSANFEGEPPARTIAEAKKYFGIGVEFYADAGKVSSPPSTIVALDGNASSRGGIKVLRKGAVKIR